MNQHLLNEDIWLQLADLFFLDIEINTPDDFIKISETLRENKWTRLETELFLVQYVAPNVGANLGFLIYPVIGEWTGFSHTQVSQLIHRSISKRKKYPKCFFKFSDWYCRRMLNKLGMQQLLEMI